MTAQEIIDVLQAIKELVVAVGTHPEIILLFALKKRENRPSSLPYAKAEVEQ